MGYQFTFTKLRLFLLLLMSLAIALLIFAGGVATGKRIAAPSDDQQVSSSSGSGPKLNAQQVALGKSLVKVPAVPGQTVLVAAAKTTGTPSGSPVPTADAPAPTTAAAATAAPETVPVAIAVAVASNPADHPFVLQVGAFRETKSAKDLQTDLQKKGYATTIYNMIDQDQRSWHMVRFGGYKDVASASKAASDFTGKEGIQALVKRFDAL